MRLSRLLRTPAAALDKGNSCRHQLCTTLRTDSHHCELVTQELRKIKELLHNPFAARIAEVFSSDGSGRLDFKNFLELFAVFSPRASFDVKVIFLFAMWDFDGELFPLVCIASTARLALS